jgi:hypothetical protein
MEGNIEPSVRKQFASSTTVILQPATSIGPHINFAAYSQRQQKSVVYGYCTRSMPQCLWARESAARRVIQREIRAARLRSAACIESPLTGEATA